MATTREHEQEIARLQDRLGNLLARLDAVDDAALDYASACDSVMEAAQQLIAYEQRLPALLGARPRQISMFVLRGCGAATMLIAAAVALSVVPGARPWWWLLIAVALAVCGARLLITQVSRDDAGHLRQRRSAALITAGAVLIPAAQLGLATAWLLIGATVLIAAGLLSSLPQPQVQLADLPSEQPIGDRASQRPAGPGKDET